MSRTVIVSIVAAALLTGACGSSPQEQQAEQVEQAADQVQQSAEGMAKGLEDMAKGLSAMAGGDPDAKPVDPVSFRDLQTAFPAALAGWERGTPTGERMTMPVSFSQAEIRFTRGDAEIEQKIVDSAFNQLLVAPFAMFLTAGYEKETETGYERSVKVGEYPGWEKWDRQSKNGELNVVVNKRFIVQVEGHGIEDPSVLRTVVDTSDLGKLAALK